jgi:lipoyl(octanoyl) transferase
MSEPLVENPELLVEYLGKGVPYAEGLVAMRERSDGLQRAPAGPGRLLLLEHAPVVTVTRSGGLQHLQVSAAELAAAGVELAEADRGGDVTFHGPGQLVGYPVLRLRQGDDGRADLVGYLRALEAGLVRACERLGVRGCHTKRGMTGVWVGRGPDDERANKLVAIGVGVNKGVTRHGFALNVDIDLERYTSRIVPCGLSGRGVTSLARELGQGSVPKEDELLAVLVDELALALGLRARAAASDLVSHFVSNTGGDRSPNGALHG